MDDPTRTLDFTTLSSFETYKWTPLSALSIDENFLDLTLMVNRSSVCHQGLMGCIVVRPQSNDPNYTTKPDPPPSLEFYTERVILASVNTPFYKPFSSDVHAEINAISAAAKAGIPTINTYAYISMPPCCNCFQALVQAGVKRMVSRRNACESVLAAAEQNGSVELVDIRDTQESMQRRMDIVKNSGEGKTEEQVKEDRKRRKEQRMLNSIAKKQRREAAAPGKQSDQPNLVNKI